MKSHVTTSTVAIFLFFLVAGKAESDFRAFLATNIFPYGGEFQRRIHGFGISDPNEMAVYVEDKRYSEAAMSAITCLSSNVALRKETLKKIERVVFDTENLNVEVMGLNVLLRDCTIPESLSIARRAVNKIETQSLIILMHWVSSNWHNYESNSMVIATGLVNDLLVRWGNISVSQKPIEITKAINVSMESVPFGLPEYRDRVDSIYLSLIANSGRLMPYSHTFLIQHLVKKSDPFGSIQKRILELIVSGHIERAQLILWILKSKHSDAEITNFVLQESVKQRPELADYVNRLQGGKVDMSEGLEKSYADLSRAVYREKSFP